MNKRLTRASGVFIVAIAAAQLIRPDRANPRTDPRHAMRAGAGVESSLVAVLDRACRDCHSNDTVWPALSRVAPLSWAMAAGVSRGRQAVNFSEWNTYSLEAQRTLLSASCDDASSGTMPGIYTYVRPETRLSRQDVETICNAARVAEAASLAEGAK